MREYFYAVCSDLGEILPTTIRGKMGESETQARLTEPYRYSQHRELFKVVRVHVVPLRENVSYQPFANGDNK